MIISIETHVAADIKIFVNIFFDSSRFFKISRFQDFKISRFQDFSTIKP